MRTHYIGNKLSKPADYALAKQQFIADDPVFGISNGIYTPAGTYNLLEPAIEATHANGQPGLDLIFKNVETKQINSNLTLYTLTLADSLYPFVVKLKGLDPNKTYSIKELNLYDWTKPSINESLTYSGDFLMNVGFNPKTGWNKYSTVFKIDEIK